MSQLSVGRTENWKFTHAAAAMGAFWAQARKVEERRRRRTRPGCTKARADQAEARPALVDVPLSRFEEGDIHDVAGC